MEDNKEEILKLVGEHRYQHILRVRDTAIKLARHYKEDEKKAEIAAYYHDCAKTKDLVKLNELANEYGLVLTEDMKKAPKIIHAFLGALMAQKKYGIEDRQILNAIKYHTTGRKNMSKLEKIIFISDYIEPGRNFEGLDEIRELAYKNLDLAIYKSLNMSISDLLKRDEYVVVDTLEARNYIMETLRCENSLKRL